MSFGWMDSFRAGQWYALRSFLLRERQNVPLRVRTILEEIKRIGIIRVVYKKSKDRQGTEERTTEERAGFYISSLYESPFYAVPGSIYSNPDKTMIGKYATPSLLKLVQAYVASGGNPLDISLFLKPDIAYYLKDDPKITEQPYGGYISIEANFKGEMLPQESRLDKNSLIKKPFNRMNSSITSPGPHVQDIANARGWANKEIMTKRNRIEENIIKLCDLREQLFMELFYTLKLSLWGTFDDSDPNLAYLKGPANLSDLELLNITDNHLFHIIAKIDGFTFKTKKIGNTVYIDPESVIVTTADADKTRIFPDDPEEKNTAY